MKRSLVLAARAKKGVGGQGLNLEHMVEALRHDFELRTFSLGYPGVEGEVVPGSRLEQLLTRVPWIRRRRDWLVLAGDLSFDRYVASRLPREGCFMGVVGQCSRSMRQAKAGGLRTVLDVVNMHIDDFRHHVQEETRRFGLPPFIGEGMYRRVKQEYDAADRIRVMSDRARATFLRRGFAPERVFTATPPIDPRQFPEARFDEPVFRVCFIGLLEPWKGFHYLLEAFEKAALPDSELVLWGGAGSRAASQLLAGYQARCRNIVVRPVPIRDAGLQEVFGRASVLVHPSLSDGFSYAVAEGMASGLPVIVTENTGAADLVEEGVNGFVVPVADVTALVDRLRFLHAHRERLPEMGRRARLAAEALTPESFRRPMVEAFAP